MGEVIELLILITLPIFIASYINSIIRDVEVESYI